MEFVDDRRNSEDGPLAHWDLKPSHECGHYELPERPFKRREKVSVPQKVGKKQFIMRLAKVEEVANKQFRPRFVDNGELGPWRKFAFPRKCAAGECTCATQSVYKLRLLG